MGKFRCAKDVRSVVMPQSVTMPILTVIGNKEMYIENFKSIMEYECDSVKVITRRGIVHVKGSDLDFVLLTHAHMDHSGNLPAIYAKGFQGPVYATQATCHLCDIMLRDSAHIQMFEAEWRNRKGRRQGKPEFIPAYTMEDALGVLQNFVPCPYEKTITPAEGIRVRFVDAGHLLGSASIEVIINEDGKEKKIVFSGDIGNLNQPLIKDPVYLHDADYVVMESTYGDRSHGDRPDYVGLLSEVIQRTFDRGGSVIIPSFAVGRTQEMLYFIRQIKEEGRVHGHDNFKVYVDSTLANEATTIFNEHIYDCFDEEALALVNKGINPLMFPGLKTSITSDDSKAINFDEDCKVIISASGMCDAGRIKHHLKHNLWNPNNTILFVGYQAIGTLGRSLLEGATEVKLFGETVHVNAEILNLPGISGHADKDHLTAWVQGMKQKPKRVFVVHGQDQVTDNFAAHLKEVVGVDAVAPYSGDIYDLQQNLCVVQGSRKLAEKRKTKKAGNSVFDRLLAAGQRLIAVIHKNKEIANKDMAKFADQINALCDKWDR